MTASDSSSSVDQDAAGRFFELSIDMLTFADFSGYFGRLSPSWERTIGWTLEELRSRPMIEFVHPDDRERTRIQNQEVRAGGAALAFENRYRCKDGSCKWFLWNAVAEVRQLQAILPICSYCRKVRDPEDFWHSVEDYIAHHADSRFSHGICSECFTTTVKPMLDESERG
jgi:PAS domain S-box-containing protein